MLSSLPHQARGKSLLHLCQQNARTQLRPAGLHCITAIGKVLNIDLWLLSRVIITPSGVEML
jgi:hypothetical protein